jgi:hypothetical protein
MKVMIPSQAVAIPAISHGLVSVCEVQPTLWTNCDV